MHIAVVTSNYPYSSRPYYGTFVQLLVRAFARSGAQCTVIRPLGVFSRRYGKLAPKITYDTTSEDNPIAVWTPRYLSVSAKNFGFLNSGSISRHNYDRAVSSLISGLNPAPDLLYGHFLYPSGALVVRLGLELGIPSVVAVGDSSVAGHSSSNGLLLDELKFSQAAGLVAVSRVNKRSCVKSLKIPEEKIRVFPNGVDLSRFYPRDRIQMRNKFGFPPDKFVIAFTGSFSRRKGPNRLLSAVSGLDNVGLIFLGAGPERIVGGNILFKGVVNHSRLPEMLSAADIFVLPTLAEGCCNAILESLACGLPVVSSKGEYNDEILDPSIAIRVDPLDIGEIRKAILKLRDDKNLREQMSRNALARAKQHCINQRARKMLRWIGELKTSNSKRPDCLEYDIN